MPEPVDYSLLFLQVLRDSLPSLKLYSDEQLTKKIGKEKLRDCSLEMFGFIFSSAGDNLMKVEQLALAHQIMKCLHKYVTQIGLPITLKTVLDSIGMISHAVNQCYPGYAESGLLRQVILPVRAQ